MRTYQSTPSFFVKKNSRLEELVDVDTRNTLAIFPQSQLIIMSRSLSKTSYSFLKDYYNLNKNILLLTITIQDFHHSNEVICRYKHKDE